MLLRAGETSDRDTVRGDVCVIGAGPTGIALARELSARGLQVVLLESGGLPGERTADELAVAASAGEPYWPLDENRRRALGGTSALWGGWCRPLDGLDLASRPWVPMS